MIRSVAWEPLLGRCCGAYAQAAVKRADALQPARPYGRKFGKFGKFGKSLGGTGGVGLAMKGVTVAPSAGRLAASSALCRSRPSVRLTSPPPPVSRRPHTRLATTARDPPPPCLAKTRSLLVNFGHFRSLDLDGGGGGGGDRRFDENGNRKPFESVPFSARNAFRSPRTSRGRPGHVRKFARKIGGRIGFLGGKKR
eukprot:1181763-Prorocentrum_minimum.AAC.2